MGDCDGAGGGAEENWNRLTEIFKHCIEKYVPKCVVAEKKRPRWLSLELLKLIRRKKAAWKTYRFSGTVESKANYEKLERDVKTKIQKAKRKVEKDLVKRPDDRGKNFSKYIKSKTKSKTGIGPLKNEAGLVTSDNKEMAEI
jgi:hypothetical protein